MNIIIFPNDTNGIAVMISTGELDILQTAIKDVPNGKPFKIVNTEDLPPEAQYWDEFFDALEHDFGNDFDGIGGQK
jgi:hypothetical protein